jgi:hypothetical protein
VSGRYFHNLKVDPAVPVKERGIICMHINESKVNDATFARTLSEGGGYKVGLFGKVRLLAHLSAAARAPLPQRVPQQQL